MARDLVFLDTETTGLDPARHQPWEVAWALNGGPIETTQIPHGLNHAEPAALRINGYLDRYAVDPETTAIRWHTIQPLLKAALTDAHIVGSNPAFDAAMLKPLLGTPWHHRHIDIASLAMVPLGWDRPRGLADVAKELGVEAPDHTAAGDVHVVRECYRLMTGCDPS